jgi:hypothetical protein
MHLAWIKVSGRPTKATPTLCTCVPKFSLRTIQYAKRRDLVPYFNYTHYGKVKPLYNATIEPSAHSFIGKWLFIFGIHVWCRYPCPHVPIERKKIYSGLRFLSFSHQTCFLVSRRMLRLQDLEKKSASDSGRPKASLYEKIVRKSNVNQVS